MEIIDYLRVVRRGWRWIALAVVLSTGAAAWITMQQTPKYEATTMFFVSGQPAGNANEALTLVYLSQQRISSYPDLVASQPNVDRALALVPGAADAPQRPVVRAAQKPNTFLMTITVTDTDPVRAAAVANAYNTVFPDLVEAYERPANGGSAPVRATLVEPARVPTVPVSPHPEQNLMFGFALGALLGCGVALLVSVLDTSVKTVEEMQRASGGVNVLGGIPYEAKGDRLLADVTPRSPRAEAFRQVRTNVQFAGIDSQLRSIVVTSPMPGEGKSSVAANLAIALAHGGLRVLIVDADLRRPSIGEYFGIEGAVGLTNLLLGGVSLRDVVQPWRGGLLDVLPSGPVPPNPAEVIGSNAMLELITFLEDRYDTIIFDAPPVVPVTDAALLAANTDGVVVVVRAGRTTKEQITRTCDTLRRLGVRLIGMVANGVTPVDGKAYNYTYAQADALVSAVAFPKERLRFATRRRDGATPNPTARRESAAADALTASARIGRWQRVDDAGERVAGAARPAAAPHDAR